MRMLLLILTLALGIFLLSASVARRSDSPPPVSRQTIRYLALGDSYTIGESVTEAERWPMQLAEKIKTAPQFERGLEVTIIARTGWTTNELWQGIQKTGVIPPYDLVSLLVGINNQYRGYPLDDYRAEFRYLLGKAIEYAGNDPQKVFVVSIPDWGITPFAAGRDREQIAAEIDAFNAINHAEAERAGVAYVDITPYSRTATANSDLIAPDGLHPSGKMYTGWVEKILPVALKALEK